MSSSPRGERKPRVSSVLDASALLAYIKRERGWERVGTALTDPEGCYISTVNLAEVLSKLADDGENAEDAARTLRQRGLVGQGVMPRPLTERDATEIAALRPMTRRLGLSLGDRACLALARLEGATAVTTDSAWKRLQVGVRIDVIR